MNRQQRRRQKARRSEQQRVDDARRRKREERRAEFQARVAAGERRGCLFCRKSDGGFTTVEHALAESVGNTEIVLENGVVCDRCNNGELSNLDQALADFWPLKMRRTFLGVRTKAGKVPVTKFHTGSVKNTGDNNLFIELLHASDTKTFRTTELGGGRVKIDMSATGGKRMTERYASDLSRALLKSCLECAWLDHGEMMLEPDFDHVREAVLGTPRDGYIAILRKADPEGTSLELQYRILVNDEGRRFLAVAVNFYGIFMATDSFNPMPQMEATEEQAVVITFTAAKTGPRRGKSVPQPSGAAAP
jgi:hypothetical protein